MYALGEELAVFGLQYPPRPSPFLRKLGNSCQLLNHHIVVMTSHHIYLYPWVDERSQYEYGNTSDEKNARGAE